MNTFTPGPLSFKDDFDLCVGQADDPSGHPTAVIVGPPGQMFGNAILYSKAPDMFAAMDPDALEAIADEIDCPMHSTRAHSLRVIAARQRAAMPTNIQEGTQ